MVQSGGSSGLLMDLAANEKDVHSDFFNGKYLASSIGACYKAKHVHVNIHV